MLLEAEARVREVLERNPLVVCGWMFGSTLSGRRRADSDLDIGVLTTRKLTWQEYAELQQDLVQAVDSDAVDLVLSGNPPALPGDPNSLTYPGV